MMLRPQRDCALLPAGPWKVLAFAAALILGGILLALGRTAPAYSWASWGALLPLLFSIQVFRVNGAFLCGLLWGVSFFIASTAALGSDVPRTWSSFVLLATAPAIYTSAAAWLARRVGTSPLVIAFAWLGVEAAVLPLGLHNGLLNAGQSDGSLLHPISHLFGYLVVAFLVAFVNATLAVLLRRIRPRPDGRRSAPGSSRPQSVLIGQTWMRANCFLRFSLIPRAPPI